MADLQDLWFHGTRELKLCAELMPSRRFELFEMLDLLWVDHDDGRVTLESEPILRLYKELDPAACYDRICEEIPNRAQKTASLTPDVPMCVESMLIRDQPIAGAEWIFCQASRVVNTRKPLSNWVPSPDDLDGLQRLDLELEAFVVYSVLSSWTRGGMFSAYIKEPRMQAFIERAASIFNRRDGGDLAMLPRNDAELAMSLSLVGLGVSESADRAATLCRCVDEWEHWESSHEESLGDFQQLSPGVLNSLSVPNAEIGGSDLNEIDKWDVQKRVELFKLLSDSVPNRLTCGGIIKPPSRKKLSVDQKKVVGECIDKLLAHSPLARSWMSDRDDEWKEWFPSEPTAAAPPVAMDVVPPAESARPRAQDEALGSVDLLARIVQIAVPIDATRPYSSMHARRSVASVVAGGPRNEVPPPASRRGPRSSWFPRARATPCARCRTSGRARSSSAPRRSARSGA